MVRLFFDTETTGFKGSRLVQLSWILEDEHVELSRGDFLVRPDGFWIPRAATDVHGITTEYALEHGYDLKKVVYYFLGAARLADVVVGHNVEFDLDIVSGEMMRLWGKSYLDGVVQVDTMKAPGVVSMFGKWPKLMDLYKRLFGVEFQGAHNSMMDVTATEKCYWELERKGIL